MDGARREKPFVELGMLHRHDLASVKVPDEVSSLAQGEGGA